MTMLIPEALPCETGEGTAPRSVHLPGIARPCDAGGDESSRCLPRCLRLVHDWHSPATPPDSSPQPASSCAQMRSSCRFTILPLWRAGARAFRNLPGADAQLIAGVRDGATVRNGAQDAQHVRLVVFQLQEEMPGHRGPGRVAPPYQPVIADDDVYAGTVQVAQHVAGIAHG